MTRSCEPLPLVSKHDAKLFSCRFSKTRVRSSHVFCLRVCICHIVKNKHMFGTRFVVTSVIKRPHVARNAFPHGHVMTRSDIGLMFLESSHLAVPTMMRRSVRQGVGHDERQRGTAILHHTAAAATTTWDLSSPSNAFLEQDTVDGGELEMALGTYDEPWEDQELGRAGRGRSSGRRLDR